MCALGIGHADHKPIAVFGGVLIGALCQDGKHVFASVVGVGCGVFRKQPQGLHTVNVHINGDGLVMCRQHLVLIGVETHDLACRIFHILPFQGIETELLGVFLEDQL